MTWNLVGLHNLLKHCKIYFTESWRLFLNLFLFFFLILVSNLEIHRKLTILVDYLSPWQRLKKIRLHDSVRNVYIYTPTKYAYDSTNGIFELQRHPCLANQKPCMVTMATRWKTPFTLKVCDRYYDVMCDTYA